MAQYYNLSLTNSNDTEIDLQITDDTYVPILKKASDYKVSVLKFSFPSENPTFIIDNDNDYKLKFSMNTYLLGSYGSLSQEYSLFKSADFNIGNINDFLENFNRTSILAHRDLLNQLCNRYTSVDMLNNTFPINSMKTVNVNSNYSPEFNFKEFTLDFSTGIAVDMMVCSIEADFSFGVVNGDNVFVEIELIDALGNSMTIMSNKRLKKFQRVYFTDGSINSQSTTSILDKTNYQPLEPFSKLIIQADHSQRGNWKLRVHNHHVGLLSTVQIDANIKVMFSPIYNSPFNTTDLRYPKIAPALHYNQQSKTISLLYDEQIHRSAFTIELSKKLYNILPFEGVRQSNGNYVLQIPQEILTNTKIARIISYETTDIFSTYKLIDISTIILKTNLPVSGEYSSNTTDRILMSLDVSASDLNSSVFEFVNNSIASRSYQLISDLPLQQIGVSVFLKYRSTGKVIPAKLPPFTTFQMLLKFIPNTEHF
jgi:hypothetical protein